MLHIRIGQVRLYLSWIGLAAAFALAGCYPSLIDSLVGNQSLGETQTAIASQQTLVVKEYQGKTQTAEAAETTLTAQSKQGTQIAQIVTSTALATLTLTSTTPPETITATSTGPADLQSQMQSSNILLYEDMAGVRGSKRYVKDTLDRVGLPYIDIGTAIGDLKNHLIAGSPEGNEWDLVIIAAEKKPSSSGISGEYFEHINKTLDQGASVILEIWDLDDNAIGTSSSLLDRCGVEFQHDWYDVQPNNMAMFPTDNTHPILNQPNSNISLTKVSDYWWDTSRKIKYDIGDWLKLTPNSSAKLLVAATSGGDPTIHGTVTECINGRLILQTFSSHQLTYATMTKLWENYIHYALKTRLDGSG